MPPVWLEQLRRIEALARTGMAYGRDAYDLERYTAIQDAVDALVGALAGLEPGAVRQVFTRERGYATPKIDVRGALFDAGPETSDVGFFPPAELPPLSVGRVTAVQIRRMVEHHEDPSLPTDFE